ncbi:MAG: DUF4124 domain-containing protein [Xanthomonadales bacterium]|nr:DUF4124 domain-containing protein [Xanthomonadales bacterium]
MRAILAVGLTSVAVHAAAGNTVYRCLGADGVVAFQDQPCPHHEQQKLLHLPYLTPTPPTPNPVPPPPASVATPPIIAAPVDAPPQPQVPTLYACTNAVNGNIYISRSGQPAPYTAPLNMVGDWTLPLHSGAASHASAPELNRHPANLGSVTAYSVWVQDACRILSREETCDALRQQRKANKQKLKYAFDDSRNQLQQRAAQLSKDLAGC